MRAMWQWMDRHFGPMGWFSDAEKRRLQRQKEFAPSKGCWRRIAPREVAAMDANLRALAYEQS